MTESRDSRDSTRPAERAKPLVGDALALIVVALDSASLNELRQLVAGIPLVQLKTEFQHYLAGEGDAFFLERLTELHPDVCLVDFDKDREQATRTAERMIETLEDVAVFAVSSDPKPELIIQAMRCGCSEYLIKPLGSDELVEALARVVARKKEKRSQASGKVLSFLSAKGGTGVTTIAVHLGALLARSSGRKTLLVDFHPSLGDTSVFLALSKHQYHFYDLAENTHRLDSDLLQGFLLKHPSGLEVLPAPDGFEAIRHVAVEGIARTLDFLKGQYEYILVDCAPGLSDQNLTVIDHSDHVFLISTAEIPALRNTARCLEYLTRFEYSPDKIQVVINRHTKGGPINDAQIEKAIRKPIYRNVPNQYGEVIKSLNTGNPFSLMPNSEFMKSLGEWADLLTGKAIQQGKKKEGKGGVLGFFKG